MNETPDAPLSDDDMTTDVGGVLPDSDPTDADGTDGTDGGDADGTDGGDADGTDGGDADGTDA